MIHIGSCVSVDIDRSQIEVSEQTIVKLLQIADNTIDDFTLETIKNCIKHSLEFYRPEAVFSVVAIDSLDVQSGDLTTEGKDFCIGRIIASQLKQCEYIAFFACTIGEKLELHVDELFKTSDYLEAYIISLIGSEAAECMAALVHSKIQQIASNAGLRTTNRFSPGYCKWDVAEQHKLFSFFPDDFSFIQLTESALMNPVQSVSGIVGIGKNASNKPYQCKTCAEGYCIYRDRKR